MGLSDDKTYELAKRVEKAAPELGVMTTPQGGNSDGQVGFRFVGEPHDGWLAVSSPYARLLLLGVLQEWADETGYQVSPVCRIVNGKAEDTGAVVAYHDSRSVPTPEDAGRLEALTLCLEHWAAHK